MGRSSLRHCREIYCIDAAGETPAMHGEVGNDPCPGLVPEARTGVVVDADTVHIVFSRCVSVQSTTGVQVRINGGAWLATTNPVKVSDTVWGFDVVGGTISAGDTVEWQYLGGTDSIVDCNKAEDIGQQGPIGLVNDLVLAGAFMLTEQGGTSVVLVEDDTDETAGIKLEDAED